MHLCDAPLVGGYISLLFYATLLAYCVPSVYEYIMKGRGIIEPEARKMHIEYKRCISFAYSVKKCLMSHICAFDRSEK